MHSPQATRAASPRAQRDPEIEQLPGRLDVLNTSLGHRRQRQIAGAPLLAGWLVGMIALRVVRQIAETRS